MNQGVEILLARMDSNPDEFVGTSWPSKNKWAWVVDDLRRRMTPTKEDKEFGLPLRFLSDDEVRTLWEKLESLRADQFTKAVMQTLLEDEAANRPTISRADLLKELTPGLEALFGVEYEATKKGKKK